MPELTAGFVERASELFRTKTGMTREKFDALDAEMKTRAFTVAYVESVDKVKEIQDLLGKAISEGTVLSKFKKAAVDHIDTTPWHLETVFRTNIMSSYGAANWEVAQELRSLRPYARYSAVMDGRTRPEHAKLHGLVYPIDHPFWKKFWPPWDYNCRCHVKTLTQYDVEKERLDVSVALPDVRPAKDFVSPAVQGIKLDAAGLLATRKLDAVSHIAAESRIAEETAAIWQPPATVFPDGIKGNEELENLYRKADVTGKPEYYIQLGKRYLEINHPKVMADLGDNNANPFIVHEKFLDAVFPEVEGKLSKQKIVTKVYGYKGKIKREVESIAANRTDEAKTFVDRLLHGEHELPTLKRADFDKTVIRAYASKETNHISLPTTTTNDVVVHEIGHHVEFSSPHFRAAAREFRDWKAKEADGAKPLNQIVPGSGYDPKEVARWDDFSHPYKGKVYQGPSIVESPTEVISMSLEQLYGTSSFLQLFMRHSDEFYWFIGLLKSRIWK